MSATVGVIGILAVYFGSVALVSVVSDDDEVALLVAMIGVLPTLIAFAVYAAAVTS